MLISRPVNLNFLNRLSLGNRVSEKKLLAVIVILLFAGVVLTVLSKTRTASVTSDSSQKVQIQPAKATLSLSKEFSFPVKDDSGKQIGEIKYLMESAEKRDEIIVKGQKATSVGERTFLILNLKLSNNSNSGVELKTRDFVRLSINNGSEWLAPDIHNDPVEVQAISTKYTRLGFPINDSDTNLKVQVGEINGEKQVFDLNF
ncbi:MAG: hypothetical protein Q7S44_01260 [bacterium]|nr:hypothetical protein [bacterium]